MNKLWWRIILRIPVEELDQNAHFSGLAVNRDKGGRYVQPESFSDLVCNDFGPALIRLPADRDFKEIFVVADKERFGRLSRTHEQTLGFRAYRKDGLIFVGFPVFDLHNLGGQLSWMI